jgi:dCMP deaminase
MSKLDPFELPILEEYDFELVTEDDVDKLKLLPSSEGMMFRVDVSHKEMEMHRFYLDLAKSYATFSKDPRLQVGSIVVSNNFEKILGVGYNGWEKGGQNIPDNPEPGAGGAVHAEVNALIKMDLKLLYPNSYLYCTHSSCKVCARTIINSGCIGTFVYAEDYRNSGVDILRKSGIRVLKIN